MPRTSKSTIPTNEAAVRIEVFVKPSEIEAIKNASEDMDKGMKALSAIATRVLLAFEVTSKKKGKHQ